jgi:ADP-heptose:LPS heptosyltransferase
MNISEVVNLSLIKYILVIRLDEIGDLVLTTPLLRELRRNVPKAHITLIVKPQAYNLVELCPYINEIHTYNWKANKFMRNILRKIRGKILNKKILKDKYYDLALVPRWDGDTYSAKYLAYLSGAKYRIGYFENDYTKHYKGLNDYLTYPIKDNSLSHEVERNLQIIRYIGGSFVNNRLELWIGDDDKLFADQVLSESKINANSLLVSIAPGAGSEKRKWPIKNYIEIARHLITMHNATMVVVGGKEDDLLGEQLRSTINNNVINTAGKTTLRQTAALIEKCRLFIGNDAGPMHIAAAVGTPVIAISCHPKGGDPGHYNSPKRFGPWGVPNIVLQPPEPLYPCTDSCIHSKAHCISNVSIGSVISEINIMLNTVTLTK